MLSVKSVETSGHLEKKSKDRGRYEGEMVVFFAGGFVDGTAVERLGTTHDEAGSNLPGG